ncbi:MAG: hypothetical protein J4F31_10790 [Flavobacteriales bacterium]|nr:hypothetical protein [Flavobacteriales bacterium]
MRIFLILILFVPALSGGQIIQSGPWQLNREADRFVDVSYAYALGSASIPFAAQRSFLFDDYLDDQDKELFLSKAKDNNQSALNDLFEFNYGYRLSNARAQRRTFGIHYNSIRAVNYSENLLRLALYGNAPFADDTLDLSPTAWWRIKYLEAFYSWGFDTEKWSYDITAAVLLGMQEQRFQAERLNWFTPSSGEYIALSTAATGSLSDTTSGPNSINGLGIGTGFTATYRGNDWTFIMAVENLGFIRWNPNSYSIDVDTNYTYEGLYIDNLFDIQDNFFERSIYSLGQAYFSGDQGSRIGITPFLLRFEAIKPLSETSRLRLGAQYRYRVFNLPLIYAAYDVQLGEIHRLSPTIHYGGYNRLGVSLDYRARFSGFTVLLQAGNLNSWVAPQQSYGIHLGLGIRKTW